MEKSTKCILKYTNNTDFYQKGTMDSIWPLWSFEDVRYLRSFYCKHILYLIKSIFSKTCSYFSCVRTLQEERFAGKEKMADATLLRAVEPHKPVQQIRELSIFVDDRKPNSRNLSTIKNVQCHSLWCLRFQLVKVR